MNPNLSAKLSTATAAALFFGALTAAALAGPSAPSTVRPGAKLFSSPAPAGGCVDCKNTPIVVARNVGVPNKGQTEWIKVGAKHECSLCRGAIVAKADGTSDQMTRDAAKCGPMHCCLAAKK